MKDDFLKFSGFAILGILVYLYLKPKVINNQLSNNSMLALSNQNTKSQISVPPTGTVLTSPEEVAETAQKIADAKAIALEISDLKKEKEKIIYEPTLVQEKNNLLDDSMIYASEIIRQNKISEIELKLKDFDKIITDLGYTEVNGKIIKII